MIFACCNLWIMFLRSYMSQRHIGCPYVRYKQERQVTLYHVNTTNFRNQIFGSFLPKIIKWLTHRLLVIPTHSLKCNPWGRTQHLLINLRYLELPWRRSDPIDILRRLCSRASLNPHMNFQTNVNVSVCQLTQYSKMNRWKTCWLYYVI